MSFLCIRLISFKNFFFHVHECISTPPRIRNILIFCRLLLPNNSCNYRDLYNLALERKYAGVLYINAQCILLREKYEKIGKL